ncbi:hypothetical protein BH23CHL2_BH23CHL2_19710 [soil metagenome]
MIASILRRRGDWRAERGMSQVQRGRFVVEGAGRRRRFAGRLYRDWDGSVVVLIRYPPRHGRYRHESCLMLTGDGWFRLHFKRQPASFESAILCAEEFLGHCLMGGGR